MLSSSSITINELEPKGPYEKKDLKSEFAFRYNSSFNPYTFLRKEDETEKDLKATPHVGMSEVEGYYFFVFPFSKVIMTFTLENPETTNEGDLHNVTDKLALKYYVKLFHEKISSEKIEDMCVVWRFDKESRKTIPSIVVTCVSVEEVDGNSKDIVRYFNICPFTGEVLKDGVAQFGKLCSENLPFKLKKKKEDSSFKKINYEKGHRNFGFNFE